MFCSDQRVVACTTKDSLRFALAAATLSQVQGSLAVFRLSGKADPRSAQLGERQFPKHQADPRSLVALRSGPAPGRPERYIFICLMICICFLMIFDDF